MTGLRTIGPAACGAAAVFLAASLATAQDRYADPDSPAVAAAAREALSRAKTHQLSGKVLPIGGREGSLSGRTASLSDIARDLNAAHPGLVSRVSPTELRLNLPESVLFDFDRADLRPSATATLDAVADAARRSGARPIHVEGYTDAKGADAYNLTLSQKRADAVRNWLVGHEVSASRLSARGFGKARPVAPNTTANGADDPAGRQKNRRVEVVIIDAAATGSRPG